MSNKKKLKQNIIYNGVYQVVILLIPIITVPYVTRIFTADDLGVNSYTLSIVQIFVTLSFFGLNQYGGREIAFATTHKERNRTFWEIWLLQIGASVLSYTMFLLVLPMIAEQYTTFLYIQGFLILL
ncbi:MAG: lipopolysaccharide biosynthesis protein, partial [Culicoidibacterales bacterium]